MSAPTAAHASYLMLVMIAGLVGPALYFVLRARRGKRPKIRRIAGIDAIEEAIGRATELGRPIVFTTGLTGLSPLLYACLGILSYVARHAARMGARLIVPQCDVMVMPIVEEVVREAYRAEGKLEQFRREDIRFLSPSQFAFASGYMGIVHRERAASCFLFGAFAAESLILGEAGQQVGAMQVAGTISNEQVPFFITTCDYTLIGEEVYAAGAYLSEEASQLGGLRGQDVAKMFVLGTISLGLLFALFLTFFRGDSEEGRMYASPFTQALYAKPMSRRCLARLDISVPFAPSEAPSWDDLNPDLGEASCDACEAAGKLAQRLRAMEREFHGQAAWLRESAALTQGGHARRAVEEVAARCEAAAARAAKEAEAVSLAAEGELRAEERYRKIAGELFLARARPLTKRIAGWSNAGSGWSDERVGEALARAKVTLDGLAASPTDEGAQGEAREAVQDAYELACDRYYDLVRERLRELESKAAADEYPAGESPVILNATKSIDADGDELVYSFDYGDGEKAEEGPAPVARHAYKAAGTYAVKLTVTDRLPRQTFNVAPPPAKDSAVLRLETAAGTELELNWPLPTNAINASARLKWDFGAGDVRTERNVKHVYGEPGRHTLRVEAEYDTEEEGGEREAARRAAAEVEPALARVRKRLEKRLKAVEDLASKTEERSAALLKILGRIKASFPEEAAVAREERAILDRHEKRVTGIKEWAAGEGRDAALLRGRIELFGADEAAVEARKEAGSGKKVRRTHRKITKVYWTVEPAHAHEIEKSVKITKAAPDIPPPWSFKPGAAGKKGTAEEGAREGGDR